MWSLPPGRAGAFGSTKVGPEGSHHVTPLFLGVPNPFLILVRPDSNLFEGFRAFVFPKTSPFFLDISFFSFKPKKSVSNGDGLGNHDRSSPRYAFLRWMSWGHNAKSSIWDRLGTSCNVLGCVCFWTIILKKNSVRVE